MKYLSDNLEKSHSQKLGAGHSRPQTTLKLLFQVKPVKIGFVKKLSVNPSGNIVPLLSSQNTVFSF